MIIKQNKQIYKELSEIIKKKYLEKGGIRKIDYGPLEINDFSICFGVTTISNEGKSGIYIKIPKIVLFDPKNRIIMPLSNEDIKLAENEYSSLIYLSRFWENDDINVYFVKPLAFLRQYNAIITERFYAKHFFKKYRHQNLKNKCNKGSDSVHQIMARLGKGLSRFHQTSIKKCKFDVERVINKIVDCSTQLKSFGLDAEFFDTVIFRLQTLHSVQIYTHHTKTLKGFDVRQVFVDDDNNAFLLDPGKMKTDYKEVDLARFIVTCRILYWGSLWLFIRLSPNLSYEERFIQAYYGVKKKSQKALSLLIIKEFFKHWRMAYTTLSLKKWPWVIKRLLEKTYIDPFYKRQINEELSNLE